MEIVQALVLIQKNERGRQGRSRYCDFLARTKKELEIEKAKRALQKGKVEPPSKQE
jgi:hypothetical protein